MKLAVMKEGRCITTVEGLERDGELNPLQAAFIEHDGWPGHMTSAPVPTP